MTRALQQAPGDPRILSLQAVLSKPNDTSIEGSNVRKALGEMFDPFTGNRALALAFSEIGRPSAATPFLAEIQATLPEWTGPARR